MSAGEAPPTTFEEAEAVFIDDRWNYGLSIHEKSADAIYAALGDPSEPETGHALFTRLYGEYAGSLETFGALGLAIRNRTTAGTLIKTYVTYPPGAVKTFYEHVSRHEEDLSDLLKLPRADVIIGLATSYQDDVGANVEKFAASLENLYKRFKELSSRYLGDDGMQIRVYNKTKHAAPLLRLYEPDNPRRFEIPVWKSNATKPEGFAVFRPSVAEVQKYVRTIQAITGSMQELGLVVKLLRLSDLLYPPTAAAPSAPASNESSKPRR